MKAECATCAHWNLRASPLAHSGMAPCAFGDRWDYLPPRITCARHKPIEQAAATAREIFFLRLDEKHSRGKT